MIYLILYLAFVSCLVLIHATTPSESIVWVKRYLRSLDFKEARLTYEIAMRSRQLEISHQDPADRFIAATAMELELILATIDSRLVELNWLSTIS